MYTGLTGALRISNTIGEIVSVAYISGWNVEDKTEVIETAKLGRSHKEAYSGFQSWGASANGVVVFDKESGGHEELFKAKQLGQKVKLQLYLNDKSIEGAKNKDTYFEGYGYIESLSVDLSAEDKGNISVSVRGSGRLDLFVGDKNVKTGDSKPEMYFKMKVDENGNLIVVADEDSAYRFRLDDDGSLKVQIIR